MNILLAFLRLIHIFAGILWAGWAFILLAFIEPAVKAAGSEGRKFMPSLSGKTKLIPAMAAALLLVVLSGVIQFWFVSGGLSGAWLLSRVPRRYAPVRRFISAAGMVTSARDL